VPPDIKAFNRKLIEDFRSTRGQMTGPMAGRKLMLLTTTGKRTNQPQTVVLGFGKDGNRYVVLASANGAPEHPFWYRNLVANPVVTVEVGPEKFQARARTASSEERETVKRLIPFYEQEQKKTSREIPLVILEPAGT
jgi:deazaflavin-dependent oxidoreductase (nitroreductase family)